MLVIHDEQTVKRLQEMAERQNRSVEDVIKELVASRYTAEPAPPKTASYDADEAVRQVRRKAYAKARKYWESVDDSEKASMTDDDLDEQFQWFDEEGIPRLKSELDSLEPPPGSLAYAAMIAKRSQLDLGSPDMASHADEILDEFFAEDVLKRMQGEDETQRHTD